MGFTTSYWQKERWSRRAADTLTSYGRCWNPSLGNWDVNWRVGVLSEEQTPQVTVFSGRVSEEEEQKARLLCAPPRRSPSRPVELSFSRSPGCIVENMRVASVRQGGNSFNILNHVNRDNPVSDITAPEFGKILGFSSSSALLS